METIMKILNEQIYNVGKLELEDYIAQIRDEKNVSDNLYKLIAYLKKEFGFNNFRIVITYPSSAEFLIMAVMFHDRDILEEMIEKKKINLLPEGVDDLVLMSDEDFEKLNTEYIPRWKDLKDIEFDIIMDSYAYFNKYKSANFTNAELTAIFLHEIGHLMNISESFDNNIKSMRKYIRDNRIFNIMRHIPLLKRIAKGMTTYHFSSRDAWKELLFNDQSSADSWAVQYGYGDAMKSALGKLPTIAKEMKLKLAEDTTQRIEAVDKKIKEEIDKTTNIAYKKYLQDMLKK